MSNQAIRVGIVGAGANTRLMHIPKLQAIDGVAIVSVVNRSRASSDKAASAFDIPTVYDRWQDLVAAPDTNAIVIGTWPYLHCPVTLAALAAGKHVLCEARMAMNATEARQMLAAAAARPDRVTHVVPAPMSLRVDATIQRLIAAGYLGKLRAVEVRACTGFLDETAPLHWREDRQFSGLNIMSLGIWYETLMRWVGEATQVMAVGKVMAKQTTIPEHLDVVADLANGAQAHLQISNVAGLAGSPEAFLFGSERTLRFAEDKLFGGKRGDTALHEIAIPKNEAGGWRVEEEFINAIRGKENVTHTTFADGVKYMEFTEAVWASLREKRSVPAGRA